MEIDKTEVKRSTAGPKEERRQESERGGVCGIGKADGQVDKGPKKPVRTGYKTQGREEKRHVTLGLMDDDVGGCQNACQGSGPAANPVRLPDLPSIQTGTLCCSFPNLPLTSFRSNGTSNAARSPSLGQSRPNKTLTVGPFFLFFLLRR